MQEPRWTLDELAERVDVALAVDYAGPPSGRVRAVPDRRAIRWYTTIGLIDRPAAHRGRTALYGPRHLLQLVAVKRLQAKGLPLVAIQQELAGATDTQLARVAHLPTGSPTPPAPVARSAGGSPAAAGPLGVGADGSVGKSRQPGAIPPRGGGRARRTGFWRQPPAAFAPAPAAAAAIAPGSADPDTVDPVDPGAGSGSGAALAGGDPVATLRGVRLGEGATLLLEPDRGLGPGDLQAIQDAARPLLAVLRERGLGRAAAAPGSGAAPRGVGEHEPRREHP